MIFLNKKHNEYHGHWYFCNTTGNKYVYKYSGGLGTYTMWHSPFAVYAKEVNKTFFCYGGATSAKRDGLLHMVSYYDHSKNVVPQPTILLDKETEDGHDNPVISIDQNGYIWVYSTAHGNQRSAYISRSVKPYDIDEFELVDTFIINDEGQSVALQNYSYMQVRNMPNKGFAAFITKYNDPATRTPGFCTSEDGIYWSKRQRITAMEEGSYQVSNFNDKKIATAFDLHPAGKGVDYRTNIYYLESSDFGKTWQTADGKQPCLPLVDADNPALVKDYRSQGLNVYLKDIKFDTDGQTPIVLYLTSKGWKTGPENNPRIWHTARFADGKWDILPAMNSDSNYDHGELIVNKDGSWTVIGTTEQGPQDYNNGGEMVAWKSDDKGKSWQKIKQLTFGSEFNHNFPRLAVNFAPEFVALWSDGHCREISRSRMYFCDADFNVYRLPEKIDTKFATPEKM